MIIFARMAITVLSFLVITAPIRAETIPVRGGEHGTFTRLVFDLPERRTWRLDDSNDKLLLFITAKDPKFDLSSTFLKLGNERVTGLIPRPNLGAIELELNCDCETETFLLGERMLVVDIRDILPTGELDQDWSELTNPAVSQSNPSLTATSSTMERIFPLTRRPAQSLSLIRSDQDTNQVEKPLEALGVATAVQRAERLKAAELALFRQISRAATQGLISPRTAQPTTSTVSNAHDTFDEMLPEKKPNLLPDALHTPDINLRAQSSADRAFNSGFGATINTRNRETCLNNKRLNIAEWGEDTAFGVQIGKLRAELLGEFDRPDPIVAAKLARVYLYFGFGAEALNVLSTIGARIEDFALLSSLARIMEGGFDPLQNDLHQQFDCETNAAFWAVLANQDIPADAQLNTDAILRAINALKPHLRQHLGPILNERLILAGYPNIAAKVLKIIERGQTNPDPRVEMSNANVNLAAGNLAAASATLDTVVSANTNLSPKALIQMIDTKLLARQFVDLETARLAEAYAREYRQQPLGIELQRVHILARAASGDFSQAFSQLKNFTQEAPVMVATRLRSDVLSFLTLDAEDPVFLRHSIAQIPETHSSLAADVGNKLAARLIGLGFPSEADNYLKQDVDRPEDRARRILRSQSALAQNLPRRAEADLMGLNGKDAEQLRAIARSMYGDHQSAMDIFNSLGQKDSALAEAWLASDWGALKTSDDELLETVSNIVSPTPSQGQPPTEAHQGILAQDRALLEDSAKLRQTLQYLLGHFEIGGDLEHMP